MYQPTGCETLEKVEKQQIRLLLQSVYGQGKTYAAMTAPNPCVLNLDNNLGAHVGRKDVIDVKFYNPDFVKKYNAGGYVHLALVSWLNTEGAKLHADQTLVLDGLTNLNNQYDKSVAVPMSTRTGKPDLMQWWGDKLEWQKEFFESLKTLKCDVIVTCHEQQERNDDGTLSGKMLPLVQGSFKDQIGTHFTDIFRQHAITKLNIDKLTDADKSNLLTNYGLKSFDEYLNFQNQFESNTIYVWQRQSDTLTACKCHIRGASKFCAANWNTFSA